MFELVEFAADVIFKTRHQSGLTDTNIDMVLNTAGAAAAGFYIVYCRKGPH